MPVVQAVNVVTLALGTAVRVSVVGVMGPLVAVETTASVRLAMVAVSVPPARSAVSLFNVYLILASKKTTPGSA